MSDKFFFKGRQQPRQDHTGHGFKTKAARKTGTKKYPMQLVVTSEARQQEVEALVAEADLYAQVRIDNAADAVESIAELTALLGKAGTVSEEKPPSRNEPCRCGSGKKYKKCCG